MSDLKKAGQTFYHENENGTIDIIDISSGEVIDRIAAPSKSKQYKYNETIAAIICQDIAEGSSLLKICEKNNMPKYAVIMGWRRKYPEFSSALEAARKDRAERHAEEVVDVAEGAKTKDEAAVAKVKMDALKWSAQAFNPDKFSPKTKVVGDPDQPLTFHLETGVRRKGDPGYVNIDPLKEAGLAKPLPPGPVTEDNYGASKNSHNIQETISQNSNQERTQGNGQETAETQTQTETKT